MKAGLSRSLHRPGRTEGIYWQPIDMLKKYLAVCALLISIALVSVPTQGQDGNAIVGAAVKAMGAENLKTIQLTGSGSAAGIGQNVNPTAGWPTVPVKSYTRQIDLDALASNLRTGPEATI